MLATQTIVDENGYRKITQKSTAKKQRQHRTVLAIFLCGCKQPNPSTIISATKVRNIIEIQSVCLHEGKKINKDWGLWLFFSTFV